MPNPASETVNSPFTAFRFEVVLNVHNPPAGITNPVCNAAFAECSGLEMTMEPKPVREGGNNLQQRHLIGPVSYGQLTLRRGMTSNLDLWNWFLAAAQPGPLSTEGQITMWDTDGTPRITFVLGECLPVKIQGPSLNAKDGQVAIEEIQLAYASLLVRPAGSGASAGLSSGAGASAGLSVSGGPGLSGVISASATAGLDIG
jgi:phage tail-like protein